MKQIFIRWISYKKFIFILYLILVVFASLQQYFLPHHLMPSTNLVYPHYNNFLIFKNSFHHLIQYQDLYILHPTETWDLFKYTPTFAAFMGVVAYLPDWLGLILWNAANAFILLGAIYYLPKFTNFQKGFIAFFLIFELMTSMQNLQSNALLAGLIIFAFGFLERRKFFLAALFICLSFFIKLFGIVALLLFLFYPSKFKNTIWVLVSFLGLASIPLVFIDSQQYVFLIKSYGNMLSNDHSASYGISVMGILHSWLKIDFNKNIVALLGMIVLLISFLQYKKYKIYFYRFLGLCSILLWIVIFNHKAESPTFIIAMSGVLFWYTIAIKNKTNMFYLIFSMLLVSISPTDIFPTFIRSTFIIPYALKALPCIVLWVVVTRLMLSNKFFFKEIIQ